jgi:N-acetylglucosaminyldiphosphoundecaprenol N-acetyl-beta-D-mannosaminyltransferase
VALTLERITDAAPDILFVGLGTPKQEYWIHENHQRLGIPISIGIGASIDFVSGMVRRAPAWMQKTGGEWLFRLFVEPRRLWKRYLVGNPRFMYQVLRQRLGLLKYD